MGKIKQAQCLLYLKAHAKSSNFYIALLFFTTFCAWGINADGEGMQMEKAAILCNQMRTRKAAFLSMAIYFLSYGTASFRTA